MHEVRDGSRVLQFDGELLATSTSRRPGEFRWVEFALYRTATGNYILGRIGQTRLFHDVGCAIVERNHLKASSVEDLNDDHVSCSFCDPDEDAVDQVCIEKPRYFALVSDSPQAVIEALYKYDKSGARYLTLVAQRLIEEAGRLDERLERAYRVETIY